MQNLGTKLAGGGKKVERPLLQLIPDSRSPFPLALIHSYFIIVQGCRKEKQNVVSDVIESKILTLLTALPTAHCMYVR